MFPLHIKYIVVEVLPSHLQLKFKIQKNIYGAKIQCKHKILIKVKVVLICEY
jgi:hypothetical protein